MAEYTEDEMLILSGIQHYMFCPRQWALIHIEQQWNENRLTVEGQLLHKTVDDPFYRQKNGDVITLRSVQIASRTLGLYGLTDAVELISSDDSANSIVHNRYPGYWKPYPVEYKRGHSKHNECDEVQLTAQAMCLEEMYGITIEQGALFYGEIRHREVISFSDHLRELTVGLANEMHELFSEGKTPLALKCPHCRSCSLIDICVPQLSVNTSVGTYLKNNLYEETA